MTGSADEDWHSACRMDRGDLGFGKLCPFRGGEGLGATPHAVQPVFDFRAVLGRWRGRQDRNVGVKLAGVGVDDDSANDPCAFER